MYGVWSFWHALISIIISSIVHKLVVMHIFVVKIRQKDCVLHIYMYRNTCKCHLYVTFGLNKTITILDMFIMITLLDIPRSYSFRAWLQLKQIPTVGNSNYQITIFTNYPFFNSNIVNMWPCWWILRLKLVD